MLSFENITIAIPQFNEVYLAGVDPSLDKFSSLT